MKTNKLILGITGPISSGKGTIVDYVKNQYKGSAYTFSTMLKDVLKRFYLEINRDNLVKLSEIIRETYGEDTMAKTMGKDVEGDEASIIVVDGVRRMADIEYLKTIPGFVLVSIDADAETRYNRMLQRNEKADDATKTFEEFLADQERSTEKSIREVASFATERINNNGSFEDLHKQIDAIISKYGG